MRFEIVFNLFLGAESVKPELWIALETPTTPPLSGVWNAFIELLLISTPSLGVYYCQQLTLSVCPDVHLSVCHAPSNCFLFVSRWNRSIFWPSFLYVPLYKTLFFDFWFRPLMPKISPEHFHKIPYKSVCMADRPEVFGPTGGFRGRPIRLNLAKCSGADPCCHGNEIWARRRDPVAYRLV